MRNHRIAALALTSALLAAGCSGFMSKKNPPAGPSFATSSAPGPRPDAALLYVFRSRAEPIHAPATLLLDGAPVGQLSHWGFTWLYATPGSRKLAVEWGPTTGQLPASLTVTLEAGGTYHLELESVHRSTGHGQTRGSVLTPRTEFEATPTLARCGHQKARSEVP